MAYRANTQAPMSHILTDDVGDLAAVPALSPPQTGIDSGLQIYASLGSAVIPVDVPTAGSASAGFGQKACTGSATQIANVRTTRRALLVLNLDATNPVYLGNADVTTSTGFKLPADRSISISWVGACYGITGGSTVNVSFAETWD